MKRHSKEESEELWEWMESRPATWWKAGRAFGPGFGWVDIYKLDNWHCVYCGRDLAENEDVLAESTEEHLVPQYLFEINSDNPNIEGNVVAACGGCNGLKGHVAPGKKEPAWESRKAYIEAMREFIMRERIERQKKYGSHVFQARAKRIWDRNVPRQNEYLA